jgi:long-chain acyl-CoA synthetase
MGSGVLRDFSWGQVAAEVRRMAAHLQALGREQGWEAGAKVAILSKNCAWWLMSDLAIWMAGYVSVPLYPTLAPDTIAQILRHSEARCLLHRQARRLGGMRPACRPSLPCIAYAAVARRMRAALRALGRDLRAHRAAAGRAGARGQTSSAR